MAVLETMFAVFGVTVFLALGFFVFTSYASIVSGDYVARGSAMKGGRSRDCAARPASCSIVQGQGLGAPSSAERNTVAVAASTGASLIQNQYAEMGALPSLVCEGQGQFHVPGAASHQVHRVGVATCKQPAWMVPNRGVKGANCNDVKDRIAGPVKMLATGCWRVE